jgi:hypothetical protein
MTYSKFIKSETSKTGYKKIAGDFFGDSIYLIVPHFVKIRTPKFSLVCGGKHLSGFYASCLDGCYLGDYKGRGLLMFLLPEGLELFELEAKGSLLLDQFCSGSLNPLLNEMRSKFL